MARIRSIKPEFPQSESMGRVSRESRFCFIMLWTIADDSGRLRGNSRMLASLLFPYDEDAGRLMPGWIAELETEKCIQTYQIGLDHYIQILNWLKHQKIDKASASKIPEFREEYRILANPRESSCEDLRKGSKDQGEDQGLDLKIPAKPKTLRGFSRKTQRALAIPGDTRHHRTEQIVKGWYLDWAGIECPWDGGEAKQLSTLLKAWPNVEDGTVINCLDHIAQSDCIPKGDRPREWLGKLPKFVNGPLDQYWKSKNVNGANGNGHGQPKTTAAARTNRNLEAILLESVGNGLPRIPVPDVGTVQSGVPGGKGWPENCFPDGEVLAREPSGVKSKPDA